MDSSTVVRNRELILEPPPPAAPNGPKRRSLWWLWLLILVGGGVYAYRHYYRPASSTPAQSQRTGGGGRRGGGGGTVPVIIAEAKKGDLPVYLTGIGAAAAFNTVTVRTRIDGQLTNIAFKEGQFVHQGDLLAVVDPRPFEIQLSQTEAALAQAQAALFKDQAQLRDAKLNLTRFTNLAAQGVISPQQRDSQSALTDEAEGAIRADEAAIRANQAQIDNVKLQLTYCRITAPISGQIGLRLVDPGNMVHAADSSGLVVIAQLQPIAVLFSLPQDSLMTVIKMLRSGVPLRVDAYDRDNTTKISSGTLNTIDNQIDPNTGTYKLKAVFDNRDNVLFPNQFVNVHLLLETRHGETIIPVAAIQRGPQGNFVYVVTPKKTVTVRPVKVDITEENTVGITDGLNEGDVVVIDGQDKLQEGARVDPRTPTGSPEAQFAGASSKANGGEHSGRRGGDKAE